MHTNNRAAVVNTTQLLNQKKFELGEDDTSVVNKVGVDRIKVQKKKFKISSKYILDKIEPIFPSLSLSENLIVSFSRPLIIWYISIKNGSLLNPCGHGRILAN
ncbi:hypothetical protein PHYBLDRAFT_60512 [Phycomyces blakesleeanus NRRL 1555(-)]|uniref:Uncharacterized protein n=1 Tax=Phycomyces blakesleeanus (strain ATCC 8743b / DSM 1359 / FGSC 10004 / NBRC 33097 / NRRL 1555) TaxID=763407 RepID=A0A167P753_PHYB8|nr:hypothetical protein PHYBLDRAFT_60512 [Phycomyces blakesleeanus NRRL 1555(-)]OAD77379.1 hypothetical protein PHYBLDRAFT_60512 [Phycomyces blakesleeanus NRRL 1555(-)]|eukprot:XP_018295419.1 hypothetical protein PHYBLDRAFT_60512 [Phycomyces blakesleeanus NRRL 1555(-)]